MACRLVKSAMVLVIDELIPENMVCTKWISFDMRDKIDTAVLTMVKFVHLYRLTSPNLSWTKLESIKVVFMEYASMIP